MSLYNTQPMKDMGYHKQQPLLRSTRLKPRGFLFHIRDMLNWEKSRASTVPRLEMPRWVYPRPNMTSLELESLISANSRRLVEIFSSKVGISLLLFIFSFGIIDRG